MSDSTSSRITKLTLNGILGLNLITACCHEFDGSAAPPGAEEPECNGCRGPQGPPGDGGIQNITTQKGAIGRAKLPPSAADVTVTSSCSAQNNTIPVTCQYWLAVNNTDCITPPPLPITVTTTSIKIDSNTCAVTGNLQTAASVDLCVQAYCLTY